MEKCVDDRVEIPDSYELSASEYASLVPEIPALDNRVILKNDLPDVVVFSRSIPTTYRVPYFFTTSIARERSDIAPIETIIERVLTHLSPKSHETFTYGLRFSDIQICGTTPEQFLEDLEQFGPNRECSLAELGSYEPVHNRPYVRTAALWPLKNGWLSLSGGNVGAERQDWQITLLCPGLPFDTNPITAFFESITEDAPGEMYLSPLRKVTANARSSRAPLPFVEPVGNRLTSDRLYTRSQFVQASNPLYNCEELVYAVSCESQEITPDGQFIAAALTSLPTLLYTGAGIGTHREEDRYTVSEISVVDGAPSNVLFVSAMLRYW